MVCWYCYICRAKFFVLNEKRTIREIIDSILVYKLNSPF
ncbi:unnamed protein product [Brassica rapa subsp. narinosa]